MYHVVMKLKDPFETSFGKTVDRHCVIFSIEDKSGEVGWGEAPVDDGPWYSYETVWTTLYVADKYLIPGLIKLKVVNSPEDFINAVAKVRGFRMAKAGIEMALWDLNARLRSKPLYRVIGGVRNYILSGISIGIIGDSNALLKAVAKFLNDGYRRIKIKIKPGWDIYPVRLLRAEFGDIPLQVDANASYTLNHLDTIMELDKYELLMIEQPLSYEDLSEHAELQSRIKTPVCLDESIKNIYDVKSALRLGSCRVINVKPARVGGIYETKLIHDYTLANNVPIWIGGMLETGVGRGHLIACATLPNIKYPNDIAESSRYWEEDIIEPPWRLNKDGSITVPEKPGIGVDVVVEKLLRYVQKVKEYRI